MTAVRRRWLAAALVVGQGLGLAAPAIAGLDPPGWTQPAPPFRVVGPIYYVGTEGLAAYLIQTRAGLILLDGTMAENVPAIEANIRALGFRLRDVKILLNSHAHFDHAAGLATLKRDTGATLLASAGDRPALETGRPPSDVSYGLIEFPPVKVDHMLVDGRPVTLGEVSLTPIITPGHTPGCTTWTTRVQDGARNLRVIFPCSISVAGNKLVGNRGYPGIVGDFHKGFARMRTLSADIVLPAHPELAEVRERAMRREAGDADAFIAPGLLKTMTDQAEVQFTAELARQERP